MLSPTPRRTTSVYRPAAPRAAAAFCRHALTACAIASAVSHIPLRAATQHWVGDQDILELYPLQAGTFFNPGMWRTDMHVPVPADDVFFGFDPNFSFTSPNGNPGFYPNTIYFGDFNQHDTFTENTFFYPGNSATVTNLFVATQSWTFNFGSGSSATYVEKPPPSSGSLTTTNYLAVGYQSNGHGPASLTCTGGSSLKVHDLKIGFAAGDTGTLNLAGGTTLILDDFATVGYRGTGTLNVSGGASVTQASTLTFYIGDNTTAARGTLTIADPATKLSLPTVLVGNVGSGAVSQSDGTLTSSGFVDLASGTNSSATYALSGGTLSAASGVAIGRSGIATFTQTGGTLTTGTGASIWVGQNAGSTGSYTLSTAVFTAPPTASAPFLAVGGTNTHGAGGTGTITVNNAATLSATTALTLYNSPGSAVVVNSGGILNAASLDLRGNQITLNGAGTLFLSGPAALNGTAASASIAGTGTLDLTAAARTFTVAAADSTLSISARIANGSLTKAGPGTLTLTGPNSYAGVTTLSAGTLVLGKDAWNPLLVTTGAILNSGTLVFNYAGTSTPLAAVQSRIASNAIRSPVGSFLHGLLAVDNPAASTVTVTLAAPGDANTDGAVNADDYTLLDRGFAQHLTGWSNGDFNCDGTVNQQDYLLIDTTFGQAQGLSPDFLAERQSQFGADYVFQLLTSVPEPSSLVACGFVFLPLIRRRTHCKYQLTFRLIQPCNSAVRTGVDFSPFLDL